MPPTLSFLHATIAARAIDICYMQKTTIMKEEILSEFDEVYREFLELIASFTDESFNAASNGDGWTAGQVAEHIRKSDESLLKSLTGPMRPSTREPGQYVQDIRDTFLNFTIKMESPRLIVPEKKVYDRQEAVQGLTNAARQIREVIENDDLSATCQYVEIKELGAPTRLELIHFVIVHTRRHAHQMMKIFAAIHA